MKTCSCRLSPLSNEKWGRSCWQDQSFEVTPQEFDGVPAPGYLLWLSGKVYFVQDGDLGKGSNVTFHQQQQWLCVLLYHRDTVLQAHK